MSYNSETGIISAPVSIDDVKRALGESSNDLATLCKSENINMWSLYKPCNYNDMWQMRPFEINGIPDSADPNKENIILSAQTKASIAYGTLGINFPTLDRWDIAAGSFESASTNPAISYDYTRDKPRGGLLSPYRLGDFVNYSSIAPVPFTLRVSWNEGTANVIVGLSTNTYGIKAKQFDYNIYKNIIWRIAIAYKANNDSWRLFIPGSGTDLTAANGFLQGLSAIQTSVNFSISLVPNTNYKIVGLLVAYKITRTDENNPNKPITDKISPIWYSSIDSERCAIPMPCNMIVTTSGAARFNVTIDTMYGVRYAAFDDDSVIIGNGNQYFAVIPVTFTAGSSSYTVTNVQVSVNVPGSMLAGLGTIDDFTLGAYKSKTINVYYCVGKTGTYDINFTINNGLMSDKPWSYNSTQTVTISNLLH